MPLPLFGCPDAAQGEATLMCSDTSAAHHPPSTEWAPMGREWPRAAAFLSGSVGIALAALGPCALLGHASAGCWEPQACTGLVLKPISMAMALGHFL